MSESLFLIEDQNQSKSLDVKTLIRDIWFKKWVIALTTMLGILASMAYLSLVSPVYTATSAVLLEPKKTQFVNFENVVSGLTGDQSTINTQLEVLRSHSLMSQVADHLDLFVDPEFYSGESTNPDLSVREEVISRLKNNTKVSNVHNSYIFKISVTTGSPKKSSDVANAIAEIYIANQLDEKVQTTRQASDWLSVQVEKLEVELEAAETAVKDFNSKTDLMGREDLDQINRQAKKTRNDIREIADKQARITSLVDQLTVANANNDDAALSEVADKIRKELSITSSAMSFIPMGQNEIDELISLAQESNAAQSNQKRHLSNMLIDAEMMIEGQSRDLVALEQLTRKASAVRSVYEHFLGKLQETSAQQGIHQADSKILSMAPVPLQPSSPQKKKIAVLFALTGLVMSTAFVVLTSITNNAVRHPSDLKQALNVNILAKVPSEKRAKRSTLKTLISSDTNSLWEDSFRNLSTAILRMDDDQKIFMMTSATSTEGKTTVTLSLAAALAKTGKRVLIIDGDARRNTLSGLKILEGESSSDTLVSAMEAQKIEADHIASTVFENVDFMKIGKIRDRNFDTLLSGTENEAIRQLKEMYDYILLDTPPILPVPDTKILAQMADAVLVVVRWNWTSIDLVTEAVHELEAVTAKPSGIILNQIDVKKSGIYNDLSYYS